MILVVFALAWWVVFAVAREGSDLYDDAEWAVVLPGCVGVLLAFVAGAVALSLPMGVILWVTR
jgi:hypothetical protein